MAEEKLLLLDEPGEPLGAYLRQVLTAADALGDGSGGVVLPRLTGEVICQVYAGVCLLEPARLTLACLLAGRRVWCPWEGLEPPPRGPLGRRVRERLWALRRGGLVLCPLGQLAQLAQGAREGRGSGYGAGPGAGVYLVRPKNR